MSTSPSTSPPIAKGEKPATKGKKRAAKGVKRKKKPQQKVSVSYLFVLILTNTTKNHLSSHHRFFFQSIKNTDLIHLAIL